VLHHSPIEKSPFSPTRASSSQFPPFHLLQDNFRCGAFDLLRLSRDAFSPPPHALLFFAFCFSLSLAFPLTCFVDFFFFHFSRVSFASFFPLALFQFPLVVFFLISCSKPARAVTAPSPAPARCFLTLYCPVFSPGNTPLSEHNSPTALLFNRAADLLFFPLPDTAFPYGRLLVSLMIWPPDSDVCSFDRGSLKPFHCFLPPVLPRLLFLLGEPCLFSRGRSAFPCGPF